ncbi:SHOCT domain-containing protein [Natrinema salinisoli]|uniref:SHOCT domain-containing protein n=1 Tax=Natrinema salinisoli TaxID=2878535 RepID=UPI001CEFF06B|nr:SHOCT domain-containing protein [Natrinema salinisoli]
MSSQHQGDSLLRIVLVVLAVIVFFPLLMMVFAVPMMGMMGWWWGGGSGMGVSPIWGIGMMLLFLLILLGVGYLLYRGLVGGQVLERDRALEELRTAYARGDLTDEEFEQRRQRLQRDQE